MIAFLLSPLGKYVGGFLIVLALVAGAALAFNRWLANHDAAVKEALVSQYEWQAAAAKAAEQKRQADASKAAADNFQKQLSAAKAAEAKANADLEKGLAQYETRLADAKRQCALDDDDVSSILQLGSGKAGPVGHH